MQGWVKIHRELREWEWYHDSNMVHLLIHFVVSANHKPNKWKGKDIDRGQFLTGLFSLSEQTGISVRTLRTCLDRLVECGEIDKQTTNKNTLITLLKYDKFQISDDFEEGSDKQTTNKRQANDKQTTTNKNDKKDYNDDNEEEGISGKPQKPPKPKIEFIDLGEFENIKIEKDKFELLAKSYPAEKLDWMIKKLGAWLVNKNKSVKSYKSLKGYFVSWVGNSYEEQKQKQSQNKDKNKGYNEAHEHLNAVLGLSEVDIIEPETYETDYTEI